MAVYNVPVYDANGNRLPVVEQKEITVPWVSSMHRGYTNAVSGGSIHENTLPAYYRAFLNGADWVEVDARRSSDGVYVSNHDPTITVDDTTYTIAEETAETLTNLVLSTDDEYGDCKLPTLESVLKLCLYTGMCANIDCKSIDPETLAKLVVDVGMSGRVAYANTSTAYATRILAVDANAGFIISFSDTALSNWTNVLTDYHTRQRSYMYGGANIANIEKAKSNGYRYMITGISYANQITQVPDMVEYLAWIDCKAVNRTYLDNLTLI